MRDYDISHSESIQNDKNNAKYEVLPGQETQVMSSYSLDKVLDQIGFGFYQYRLIGIIGLVALTEGSQIIVFTLSLTILQNEWGFNEEIESVVASCAFLGILIGCGIAGMIADRIGRKWCIIIASILILVVNFSSVFCTDIFWYGFTRVILSFFMGFFAPIGFTLVIESIPMYSRVNVVIFANCLIFLGQLYACFLAWLTLRDLEHGNWKALTVYSSIPTLFALGLSMFYLDESVRYDLVMNNYENVFETIEKMNTSNGKQNMESLTNEQKSGIIEYEKQISIELQNQEMEGVAGLFKGEYKATTIFIWFEWFVSSFIYYGITLFMPYVLEKFNNIAFNDETTSLTRERNPNEIGSIALSVLVESSSVIIAALGVDTDEYGRKMVLAIFYSVTGVFAFIAFFMPTAGWYVVASTATKISLDICTFFQYLYVIEVYPTKIRATGVGLAGGVGKFGAIIMPWIYLLMMDYISLKSPMLLDSILCFAAVVTIILLPIETKGREMK